MNHNLFPLTPAQSLHQTQQQVRQHIANGMAEDVEVILSGGDYYLDAPLVFTEADSGGDGYDVIWRSADGERAVIYAGLPVTDWQQHNANIYKAPLKHAVHTLYENNQRSVKARHPAKGYSRTEAIDREPQHHQFRFKDGDIPRIADIRNLQVYIWPGGPHGEWNWFTDIISIQNVDFESRLVTLAKPSRYVLGPGSRYFVMGALELLTEPGQFYYDAAGEMLYYWPRETPIENQTIIAPASVNAFLFRGRSWADVAHNIRLERLEICCSDAISEFGGKVPDSGATYDSETGIIHLENAENVDIANCKIHNTGMHGIFATGWAQNNSVNGCLIENIGFTGVLLNGPWRTIHYINKGNDIVNNYIHHTGQVIGFGAGVQITQSGENRVAHNRIHHAPRYSISIKGPYPGTIAYTEVDGINVRENLLSSFVHSRFNKIEYNDISHANTDSQDTGPIESWGTCGAGNSIENNLIHDSEIPFSFGFGIYLDDAVTNMVVRNNIIYNLNQKGAGKMWSVFYVKGVGNQFFNNIAANCNTVTGTFLMHGMLNDPNRNLTFARNILYRTSQDTTYGFRTWDEQKFRYADSNLFYFDSGEYRLKGAPDIQTFDQWRIAQTRKHDQFSLTGANPLFMDAANHDYRLRYDSPAHALGFYQINIREIGLEADFPYADADEALDKVMVDRIGSTFHLRSGDEDRMSLMGRTVSGFVADLSNAEIYYESSDPDVAAIDGEGRITATGAGAALMTATVTKNGVTKHTTQHVLVNDEFVGVEIIAPHLQIEMSQSMSLRACGRTKFGAYILHPDTLTFISKQPHIGMVDFNHVLTGVGRGKVEIEVIMSDLGVRRTGRISIQVGNE